MIAWTLAGSDSGGGAGIAADLRTFQGLGVHGCVVVCALTAQNRRAVNEVACVAPEMVVAQIRALAEDLPPAAIKTGMLGSAATVRAVARELTSVTAPLVCDPVMVSSTGRVLLDSDAQQALVNDLLPRVTLLTPNLPEAQCLLGRPLESEAEIEAGAEALRALGPQAVLIKGGHRSGSVCGDFFSDGQQRFWLKSPRLPGGHDHGTGCTLASAIAAGLALGEPLADAVVLAKAYLNQALTLGAQQGLGSVVQGGVPDRQEWLPWLEAGDCFPRLSFPETGPDPLGFYPLVSRTSQLAEILPAGVRTAQLRIKDLRGEALAEEVRASIALAQMAGCRLFINDAWDLALRYGAYGVHLGQEDLAGADLAALARAGIRLGVSTHGFAEVARILPLDPSYVAVGPIFATQSKNVAAPPRGLARLAYWSRTLRRPVVAIGGISETHLGAVRMAGADGVAVMGALHAEGDPCKTAARWVKSLEKNT